MKAWLLSAVFALLATGFLMPAARADVLYSFTGVNDGLGGDGLSVGFQYTSSSYLTDFPGTELSASQLTSCTNCMNSSSAVTFVPFAIIGSSIVFDDIKNASNVYMFQLGAFGNNGTYYSGGLFNTGKLTVSTVAVPEPATVGFTLLAGLGICGLIFMSRRNTESFAACA